MSKAEDRALAHNFVGIRLVHLAWDAPELDTKGLYDQAHAEFLAATDARPRWYLPYENLADVSSYLGELAGDQRRQVDAMERYDDAIARAARPDGYLSGDRTIVRMRDIMAELTVSKAISRLMSGSPGAYEAALGDIASVGLGDAWDPASEPSGDVLYTVACFFSRASQYRTGSAIGVIREMALSCLRYAFAANSELVANAIADPDLRPIQPQIADLISSGDWRYVVRPDNPEREGTVDEGGDRPAGGVAIST